MYTKQFLSRVLSATGNYCVFANHLANDQRKQMFFTSLDDVVDIANDLDAQGDTTCILRWLRFLKLGHVV